MNPIVAWWRRLQRAHDMAILWPVCREATYGNLKVAREIFFIHCTLDPAWSNLTQDQIGAIVARLK